MKWCTWNPTMCEMVYLESPMCEMVYLESSMCEMVYLKSHPV